MEFSTMSGWDFERYCASQLLKKGFTEATVTSSSGDHGVDIIAVQNGIKFGIQCKLYTGPVPNKAVQEAYTGASYYGCDIAVVLSNSNFTAQAKQEAEKLRVKYWNISDFITDENLDDSQKSEQKKDIRNIIINGSEEESANYLIKQKERYIPMKARMGAPYVHYDDKLDWLYCERICRSIIAFIDSLSFFEFNTKDKITLLEKKEQYIFCLAEWLKGYKVFIQSGNNSTDIDEAEKTADALKRLFKCLSDEEIVQINGMSPDIWNKETEKRDFKIPNYDASMIPSFSTLYDSLKDIFDFFKLLCKRINESTCIEKLENFDEECNQIENRLFPSIVNKQKYKALMQLLDESGYKVCSNGGNIAILNCNGEVAVFGSNSSGECQANGWTGIIDIACGAHAVFGIRKNGTVVVAGTYNSKKEKRFYDLQNRMVDNLVAENSKVENWSGILKIVPLHNSCYKGVILGVSVEHKIVTSWDIGRHLNPNETIAEQENENYYIEAKRIDCAMEKLMAIDDVVDVAENGTNIIILHTDHTATVCTSVKALESFTVRAHIWKNVKKLISIKSAVIGITNDNEVLYSNRQFKEFNTISKAEKVTSVLECPYGMFAKGIGSTYTPDVHKDYPVIAPWSKEIFELSGYRVLYSDGTMYAAKLNDYAAGYIKDNAVGLVQGILKIDYCQIDCYGYHPIVYVCVREDGSLLIQYYDESMVNGHKKKMENSVPKACLSEVKRIEKEYRAFKVVNGDAHKTLAKGVESKKNEALQILEYYNSNLLKKRSIRNIAVQYRIETQNMNREFETKMQETDRIFSEKSGQLSMLINEKNIAISKCGLFSRKKKEQLTKDIKALMEEKQKVTLQHESSMQEIEANKNGEMVYITSKYQEEAKGKGINWDEVISFKE